MQLAFTSTVLVALLAAVAPPVRGQEGKLFIRGEANADGKVDISDCVYMLGCLFLGTECPTCADSGDVDDNGRGDITDPIYLLDHLFRGGPGPPAPREVCGTDETPDELGCETFLACDDGQLPTEPDRLLVERRSRSGERSFYTMDLDGSSAAPFPGVPDDATLLVPSPDGRAIAYLRSTEDGFVNLWLMDSEGADRRPLLEDDRVVEHAAWAPDGARLAVEQSTPTETTDIWIVETGGKAVNLTPDPLPGVIFDRSPSWSPAGTRLAFSSNRSGTARLWTMNPDGTEPLEVLPAAEPGVQFSPAWSPDGELIAFRTGAPGLAAIGIVRPDGGGFRSLPIAGQLGPPLWAPDGRVLYTTDAEGNFEVYAMDPASGESVNLTRHRDHDLRVAPLRHVMPDPWLGFAAPEMVSLNRLDPPAIGAGDVNADGLQDLVALAPPISAVSVILGRPGGRFEPLGTLEAGPDQRAVAIDDVSRDGVDDIVVLGPGALALWRGGPQGPGLSTSHPFGGDGRGLAGADFDGDGSVDLAAVHDGGGAGVRMRVFGTTPGGDPIAIVDYAGDATAPGLACACDATGEGYPDVVVATADAAAPVVLIPGQGDISFAVAIPAARDVPARPDTIPLCEDLNGDRRADLALLFPGEAAALRILHATGADFVPAQEIPLRASGIAAADADRDGDVDLFLAGSEPSGVVHLRNRGDGRFAAPVLIGPGGGPLRILAADLDGDAWPDLVTVAGARLEVRRNLAR